MPHPRLVTRVASCLQVSTPWYLEEAQYIGGYVSRKFARGSGGARGVSRHLASTSWGQGYTAWQEHQVGGFVGVLKERLTRRA